MTAWPGRLGLRPRRRWLTLLLALWAVLATAVVVTDQEEPPLPPDPDILFQPPSPAEARPAFSGPEFIEELFDPHAPAE